MDGSQRKTNVDVHASAQGNIFKIEFRFQSEIISQETYDALNRYWKYMLHLHRQFTFWDWMKDHGALLLLHPLLHFANVNALCGVQFGGEKDDFVQSVFCSWMFDQAPLFKDGYIQFQGDRNLSFLDNKDDAKSVLNMSTEHRLHNKNSITLPVELRETIREFCYGSRELEMLSNAEQIEKLMVRFSIERLFSNS